MKGFINNGDFIKSSTILKISGLIFISLAFFYLGKHWSDSSHTGSGFINVGRERGMDGYDLKLQNGHENEGHIEEVMMFKTNPATNDWIPSIEDHQAIYMSYAKLNRSESG
ncbi:unnamed protein product [Camellia sinensis]